MRIISARKRNLILKGLDMARLFLMKSSELSKVSIGKNGQGRQMYLSQRHVLDLIEESILALDGTPRSQLEWWWENLEKPEPENPQREDHI